MNLPHPLPTKPSLLVPEEARSLFHELGHAIHSLCTKTKFAFFHSSILLKDFNEIPSILLENWIWTPSVLKKMGCHYSYLSAESLAAWMSENKGAKRPERELADDSIEQLLGTKRINEASTVLKRCSIDYFDMKIHGPNSREELEKMDLSEEWNRLLVEVSTMHGAEAMGHGWKWGNGPSRLGMLIRGYDAGCYSYVL